MTEGLWSEWFEHGGHGCPLPFGTIVHAVYARPVERWEVGMWPAHYDLLADGSVVGPVLGGGGWGDGINGIIRYRYRVYRAGLDMIASIKEPVDA